MSGETGEVQSVSSPPVRALVAYLPSGKYHPVFESELRLLKAALLYADEVELRRLSMNTWWDTVLKREPDAASLRVAFRGSFDEPLGSRTRERDAGALGEADVSLARAAGALVVPDADTFTREIEALEGRHPWDAAPVIPVLPAQVRLIRDLNPAKEPNHTSIRALEGSIAAALLGELEAFPDASMDTVLDVRERLAPARIHFRAAIAEAVNDMSQERWSADELPSLVGDLRRRHVDRALSDLRDGLSALGAVPTLRRVAQDRFGVAAAASTLSLMTGAGGGLAALEAALRGLVVPAIGAAVAKEADQRDKIRATVKARPYWVLYEANRLTLGP